MSKLDNACGVSDNTHEALLGSNLNRNAGTRLPVSDSLEHPGAVSRWQAKHPPAARQIQFHFPGLAENHTGVVGFPK